MVTERGKKDEVDITCSSTGIPYGSVFWRSQMAVSSGAYHRAWDHIFREDPAEDISENKNRRTDRRRIAGGGDRGGVVFCPVADPASGVWIPWNVYVVFMRKPRIFPAFVSTIGSVLLHTK